MKQLFVCSIALLAVGMTTWWASQDSLAAVEVDDQVAATLMGSTEHVFLKSKGGCTGKNKAGTACTKVDSYEKGGTLLKGTPSSKTDCKVGGDTCGSYNNFFDNE